MDPSTTALIILTAVVILYATERIPLAPTSLGACIALALFGVVPFEVAFSGFVSNVVFLVGGMIVVSNALFETGLARVIGQVIVRAAHGSELKVLLALMITAACLSAFLNNSSTTAMFISVVLGISASSGGRVKARTMLMPLAFAANAGGMLTLVGSTPPVIVQGLMTQAGLEPFGFFEFAFVGLPVLVALLIYSSTIGRKLVSGAGRNTAGPDDSQADTEPKNPGKMWVSAAIMIMCVVLFATELIPLHLTSMLGAFLVIVTGCISEKEAYRRMDWTTVFVLAGSMGLAAGLDKSGAGQFLAETVIGWLGSAATPFMIMAIIAGLGMVMTQVMSNTATTAMLAPIALFMCMSMGVSPRPVMMALATATAAAFATPIATPPNTLVLCGGYRFMDYVKVGGLFSILAYVIVIAVVPVVWPF